MGSAAPPPEATPAPLETSSPSATPKSAPALQTWAASNAGSVVNGRLTTPPAKRLRQVATWPLPSRRSCLALMTLVSVQNEPQLSTAHRQHLSARHNSSPARLRSDAQVTEFHVPNRSCDTSLSVWVSDRERGHPRQAPLSSLSPRQTPHARPSATPATLEDAASPVPSLARDPRWQDQEKTKATR